MILSRNTAKNSFNMALVISKKKAWISTFRLQTLPLALCSILLGSAIAYTEKKFDPIILGLTLLTAILLQVLSNVANDYGDTRHGADNASRIGPERMAHQKIISMQEMKRGIIILILLSLLSGILLLAKS